jgi:hypothetical protein
MSFVGCPCLLICVTAAIASPTSNAVWSSYKVSTSHAAVTRGMSTTVTSDFTALLLSMYCDYKKKQRELKQRGRTHTHTHTHTHWRSSSLLACSLDSWHFGSLPSCDMCRQGAVGGVRVIAGAVKILWPRLKLAK